MVAGREPQAGRAAFTQPASLQVYTTPPPPSQGVYKTNKHLLDRYMSTYT